MTKAKRFSSEYTMLSILEYLCLYSKKTPVSKYHIMTKINAIRQQRPDRITHILNVLEENGYIKSTIDTYLIQNYTLLPKKDLMLI